MSATPGSSWPYSADQWLDRLSTNRWIPLAVNFAAFALLAYGVAQWTWRVREPSVPPAVAVGQPMGSGQTTTIDLQPLLATHLFGQVQASVVDPTQLPLSSLNLVLTGVMARGPAGFAFLSINGAPEIFVTIGQEVTAGAILEIVYPDRIVLRRGAAFESVLLKDSDVILPPGSIVGPGAEKIIGATQPQPGTTVRVNRDEIERGREHERLEELDEAPPDPRLQQN